jgi:hypothetical protein
MWKEDDASKGLGMEDRQTIEIKEAGVSAWRR